VRNACIICEENANTVINGMVLCTIHLGEWVSFKSAAADAGRSLGPLSGARWAARQRHDVAATIRLPASVMGAADAMARARGISRNSLIEGLIIEASRK
jgi:homoserine acetyltransferase